MPADIIDVHVRVPRAILDRIHHVMKVERVSLDALVLTMLTERAEREEKEARSRAAEKRAAQTRIFEDGWRLR